MARQLPTRAYEREQIQEAVKLIAPDGSRKAQCEDDVAHRLSMWGFDGATKDALLKLPAKRERQAVERMRAAVVRVKVAAKAVPRRGQIHGPGMGHYWSQLEPLLDAYVERCDRALAVKAGPPKRNATKQRWAAEQACTLMRQYHSDAKFNASRNGPFVKLAAVFYGEDGTDLTRYCQQARRQQSR